MATADKARKLRPIACHIDHRFAIDDQPLGNVAADPLQPSTAQVRS